MAGEAPSWAQMLGRMAAVGFRTATGTIHFVEPDDSEEGTGEPVEGTTRFWFRAPYDWRVEDERGVYHLQDIDWLYVRGDQGRMQRMPRHSSYWGFSAGHPWMLLGAERDRVERFTRSDDFSIPLGPGIAVEVAGRTAWEFTLAPPSHKPHPLRVAVDDRTGTRIPSGRRGPCGDLHRRR